MKSILCFFGFHWKVIYINGPYQVGNSHAVDVLCSNCGRTYHKIIS